MRPATEITIAVLGAAVLGLVLWSAAAWTPLHNWNGARLYPAYLVAAGESLYPLNGEGVVNGWIYGPVMPWLLAPLAWIADPTWAMVAAGWVNILVLFVPVILVVDAVAGRSLPTRRRWLLGLAVAGALIIVPTTSGRLVFITCDQLAIGLGCISCFWLAKAEKISDWRYSFLAAVAASIAIWTKQTELFLPVGQIVFLVTRRSLRSAWRYAGCLIVTQAACLLLMVWVYGAKELWLNLVWIPTHHPLASGEQGLMTRGLSMLAYVIPLLVGCLWVMRVRRSQAEFKNSSNDHALAVQLLIVGAFLIPPGVLAAAKTGGDVNSFHFVYFFALALSVSAQHWLRSWLGAQPMRIAAGAVVCVAAAAWWVRADAPLRLLPAPQLRLAVSLAASEPGQIIFPLNPLVTWITERKQYHLEYGIFDRSLAGLPLSRKHFWQGMPAHLRHAVYPVSGNFFFMQLFPGLKLETQSPDLAVYAVDAAAAESIRKH